ncbi:MAG: lamin tail domain-containing protein, partial [Patescibacteria group bacterium]
SVNVFNQISKNIYHSSWPTRLRPNVLKSEVRPNETAQFSFSIQAPNEPGFYSPSFQLVYVSDGSSFKQLGSQLISWQITVEKPFSSSQEHENTGSSSQGIGDQGQNQNNQGDNNQPPAQENNQGQTGTGGGSVGVGGGGTGGTGGTGGGGMGGGGEEPRDTTPPETTLITNNLLLITNNPNITFQFSSNESNSTFQCRLDGSISDASVGAGWSVCVSPKIYNLLSDSSAEALAKAEGNHTFRVRAIDSSGNIDLTPANFSWTIDFSGPIVTLTSQPNSPTSQTTAQFEFSSEEQVIFECSLDDSLWEECQSPKIYSILSDGLHLFSLRAKDSVNNYSPPIDIPWLIDITSPIIELTNKPSNLTNQTTAQFEFQANEVVSFFCKLDNQETENCSPSKLYEDLVEGEHTFYLKAIDHVNLESVVSYTWIIDLTSPISNVGSSFDGSFFNYSSWLSQIVGSASDPDGDLTKVEILVQKGLGTKYLGYSSSTLDWLDDPSWLEAVLENPVEAGQANWRFDLPTSLLSDETYLISSRAIDISGNLQNTSSTVQFIFDDTPPSKPDGLKINRQKDSLEMNPAWNEVGGDLSGIDFYQISWQSEGQENTTSTQTTSFRLTGQDKKEYKFKLWAIDKAGNRSLEASQSEHFVKLPSMVISEIQIAGQNVDDEFIELFNGTDQDVNLTGYKIKKKNSSGNESIFVAVSRFKDRIIKAQGYLLLAHQEKYKGEVLPDIWWPKSYDLASDNTIILYNDQDQIIDKVGWGQALDFEKQPVQEPAANQSLERKSDLDYVYQDTDDNASDFLIQ